MPTVYARIEGIAEKDDSLNGRQCRIAVIDITDRNWMEEEIQKRTAELEKAKEAAETVAEAKAAFLANMSHELRTPTNAVIGFSSLLLDESFTPDQKVYIEGIITGGEALLALINDILDFSKLENEKVELAYQLFSLKHLIDESLNLVSVQANKKGLNLYCTINYDTPDTIIGDPSRLSQILVNLLSNAVKYNDKGDVSLSISSKLILDNLREILFNVSDTGIGIPQEKMNELFKPFTPPERTISSKRNGVGLGLAITKNLVDLMGGTIWAESVPGQDTTFHVMIQAETIPGVQLNLEGTRRDAAIENLSELKPMRILVAEDNPSNQKVLMEMLKRLGYRPDVVADGLEVIKAFERQNYDLVLMDIRMPEINGITVTQVIRKFLPKNGPKIVAVTAYALVGDREKYLEAGMDDYIAKPVRIGELAEVLKRCAPKIPREGRGAGL
jgi:signal transduction histidine kinase/ActR/RegA family two-component response regulator